MTKKIFALMVLLVFVLACADKKAEDKTAKEEVKKEVVKAEAVTPVAVADFEQKAEGLVEKKVSISGTVVHVCEHSGKNIFIVNENPEVKVKIVAGKNIAKFEQELNGTDVEFIGVVKEFKIDEAYLADWEKKLKEGKKDIETHEGHDHAKKVDEKATHTHADGTVHEGSEHDKTEVKKEDNCETEAKDNAEAFKKIADYRKKIAEGTKGYLSFYSVECESFKKIKE
jgi:hypothetical protein